MKVLAQSVTSQEVIVYKDGERVRTRILVVGHIDTATYRIVREFDGCLHGEALLTANQGIHRELMEKINGTAR